MSEHGSQQQPRPAYCEEFSEENQATVPETKQSANVAAKRSKPDVANSRSSRDEQIDSGYDTHSGPNSSLDSKVDSNPPVAPDPPNTSLERGGTIKKASQDRAPSPEQNNAKRAESKSRRDGHPRKRECYCDKCVSGAQRGAAPFDPYMSSNYVIAQPRQKTPAPSMPQARRAPQPAEAIMPLREHVRPRPATNRARPMSFHAGMMPEPMYLTQPAYVVERQPSARQAIYPFPPPSFPPQPPPPLPPPPQEYFTPMPIHYEMLPPARPRPRKIPSEQPRARPQSMYYGEPPPVFENVGPIYRTIEPSKPLQRQLSRRGRRESLRVPDTSPKNDAQVMQPPPIPAPKIDTRPRHEQRPPIRQTATSAAALPHQESYRGSVGQDARDPSTKHQSSRKGSVEDPPRSRRPSVARPSKTSEEKVVSFEELERDMSHLNTDPSPAKSRRRSSLYSHENLEDLEGSVLAYQQSKGSVRSSGATPSRDDILSPLVRKKTNTDSDTGSRMSAHSRGSRGSRDGSDVKRTSTSKALDRRPSNEVSTRSENERPFALRFNPEDTNVKMQGGIDGRAISLRKSKDGDGDMELSIESRASPESGRGRMNSSSSSRPPLREKSRKRYSYIEGRGVQEISGPGFEASRSLSIARVQSNPQESGTAPRVIGERIVTTMRSRRSSRYAYDGRERYDG